MCTHYIIALFFHFETYMCHTITTNFWKKIAKWFVIFKMWRRHMQIWGGILPCTHPWLFRDLNDQNLKILIRTKFPNCKNCKLVSVMNPQKYLQNWYIHHEIVHRFDSQMSCYLHISIVMQRHCLKLWNKNDKKQIIHNQYTYISWLIFFCKMSDLASSIVICDNFLDTWYG